MSPPDKVTAIPGLTLVDDEPVFAEPWQAQAFAMTVKLHEQGLFTWSEWADMLGAEIAAAGHDDAPENYYTHWLSALEKITQAKGTMTEHEREDRKQAWDRAAKATPHGQHIELGAELKHHDHS